MATITVVLNSELEPNQNEPMNIFKKHAMDYYDVPSNAFREQIKVSSKIYKFVTTLSFVSIKIFADLAIEEFNNNKPTICQVWYNDTQIY